MEIGVSSATFYPLETEKALDHIIDQGFQYVEIFINSECEFNKNYIYELKNKLDAAGIHVVSVHPYTSAIEALYFFTAYKRRAEDALRIYRNYFEMAEILGAKFFTFHGDRNIIAINGGDISQVPMERHYEVLSRLIKIASEYGIKIAQENVSWCMSANPEYLAALKKELGNEIGFTLDLKQARRAGRKIEDYIEVMRDNMVNVHISDYNSYKNCLLPGEGIMDYRQFIEHIHRYGYNGTLIIEVYSNDYDDIRQVESSKITLQHQIYDY